MHVPLLKDMTRNFKAMPLLNLEGYCAEAIRAAIPEICRLVATRISKTSCAFANSSRL